MFSAYAKLSDKRYSEVFGLDFEQFEVGQHFVHRPGITISQQDNTDEALDTINAAQLHYDAHYAEQTEWDRCLGVSTLTLQKMIGSSWKTFARKYRICQFDSIAMVHPVYGGDTLYCESNIVKTDPLEKESPYGMVVVEANGFNQDHTLVSKVEYQVLIFKQGMHPYYSQPQFDYGLSLPKFSAYRTDESGSLIEQAGIDFEDLEVDETYCHAPNKFVTAHESHRQALRSLNWDPMHIDPHYCETYFADDKLIKGCPLPETYLLGAITACTTRTFGKVVANLGWTNIKLNRHVVPEEHYRVESTILSKRISNSRPTQGIVQAKTQCFDKEEKLLLSYDRTFLVYKRDLGPYRAAGY
ncbi:MaoC family dehydratase [Shewanella sp. OPT22]|nr:MaoC family dehydratase [Shewanella sp. OPT22]